MNIATPPVDRTDHRPDHISPEEWDARVQLAACYRLMDHFGMTDLIYNHITARVPYANGSEDHHFLINPFGPHYSEITASSLVKVDLDGKNVDGTDTPINPAGYVIHACVHRERPDVNAVIHTHTRAGIAVSCLEEGLIPMEQSGLQFLNKIAYHDYEGQALDEEEQARLLDDMGDCNVMVLRNHGLLACGGSISQAFRRIYYLEVACKIQLDVMASGTLRLPTRAVQEHTAEQWQTGAAGAGGDDDETLEWPAMMRLMDRKDPSYRT